MRVHSSSVMRERMMECSEQRIEAAAAASDGYGALAATRVMESVQAWRDWSASHIRLLDMVATQRRTRDQMLAVRRMAMSMIHRKALFEFLRDRRVHGEARRRLFESTYGGRPCDQALIQEHRSFIRATCSYICVEDFCGLGSLQRICRYEHSFTRYWQMRASLRADPAAAGFDPARQEHLRRRMLAARQRLLDDAVDADDELTLAELRRPTGDTVRLRADVVRILQPLRYEQHL